MKSTNTNLALFLIVFAIASCSNNPLSGIINKLEGRWVGIYSCVLQDCNSIIDSCQTSVITFSQKNFSSALYKDSSQNALDTTFSGRYSISNDTLELTLENFSEVFYYNLFNGNDLYLEAAYSIDSKGNKIIDFRSVLWCCDRKKRSTFTKQ